MNARCVSSSVLPIRIALFAAWFLGIAHGVFSDEVKVIWQRELPDDVPGRYKRVVSIIRGVGAPTERQLEELKKPGRFRILEKIELLDGKDLRLTEAEDLVKLSEYKKWSKEMMERHAILHDLGSFNYAGGVAQKQFLSGMDIPKEVIWIRLNYNGPRQDGEFADVDVIMCEKCVLTEREFLRRIPRNGRLTKLQGNNVIEGPGGRSYFWQSGDKARIYVGDSGFGLKATAVAEAYVKKYPSTLKGDVNLDNTAWARNEMDWWLSQAKSALEKEDKVTEQHPFITCLTHLSEAVFVPELSRVAVPKSLEDKQQILDLLGKWWQQNRAGTYWHTKLQRLVAKGGSPEDLQKASVRRQQEEIQAKLNAPLKDPKLLLKELVKVFEADRLEFQKWAGPERAEGFSEVADGLWKMRRRSSSDVPWDTVEIRGPQIEKTENKRYPLQARFISTFIDGVTGKKRDRSDRFTYDKLQDKWFYGAPPKE
jgi:hypothetical protein